MGPSGQSCCEKYFKDASIQRLTLYFIILISTAVFLILVFTFLSYRHESENATTKTPPTEPLGSDVLKTVPLIDGSNNLPWKLYTQLKNEINNFTFTCDWCQTDLNKLYAGMVGTQVWTISVPCTTEYKDAATRTLQQVDVIFRLINKYTSQLTVARTSVDIWDAHKNGKIANLIGINGGHLIDNKLSVLRSYYYLGARYLTLTGGCNPLWLDSLLTSKTTDTNVDTKVQIFGKAVINELNRLGILVDLAHSTPQIQNAVLKLVQAPVIYSTGMVYNLCKLDASLKDEALQKVKENGGLVMISFNPASYTNVKEKNVTIDDVVQHLNYVKDLTGADYVGIGTEFNTNKDFSRNIKGLEDSAAFPKLFDLLAKPPKDAKYKAWSQDDLKKLAGENFLRVLQAAEKVRENLQNDKPSENYLSYLDIPYQDRTCYSNL